MQLWNRRLNDCGKGLQCVHSIAAESVQVMKITAVRLRKLRGTIPTSQPFWEERLVRPIDVYPEYRVRQDFEGGEQRDGGFDIESYFVQVETDQGVIGIAGPLPETVAFFVA